MSDVEGRASRRIAGAGFECSQPVATHAEQVVALLLDALQRLADAGEVDAACRIAGKACAVVRGTDAKGELRFNALLHRLTRKLGPIAQANDGGPSSP